MVERYPRRVEPEIDPSEAGHLAEIYNRQVVPVVPYCFPVDQAAFIQGIQLRADGEAVYDMSVDTVVVGERDGTVQALAHVTAGDIASADPANAEKLSGGFIHFLTYQPGERQVGQDVLAAGEQLVRGAGHDSIFAFCGYSWTFYHIGTPCLSDRLGHVYALLRANGYEVWGARQVFLEQAIPDLDDPSRPEADVQVEIERPASAELPGIVVRATHNEDEVAVCEAVSAAQFCPVSAAQTCAVVESVGLAPSRRRRGWGRYVLRKALRELRRMGYRTAVVGTTDENVRALLLYTNMGFHVVHRLHTLRKNGVLG